MAILKKLNVADLQKTFEKRMDQLVAAGTLSKRRDRYVGKFEFLQHAASGNKIWGLASVDGDFNVDLKDDERILTITLDEHNEMLRLDGIAEFYIGHPQNSYGQVNTSINLIKLEIESAKERRLLGVAVRELSQTALQKEAILESGTSMAAMVARRKLAKAQAATVAPVAGFSLSNLAPQPQPQAQPQQPEGVPPVNQTAPPQK